MELLVLGDSLPFGRGKHQICRHKTWPYIIAEKLNTSLCIRAKGGATIFDVLKEATALEDYWFDCASAKPFDAVIVQVGIVDVCPRILPYGIYDAAKKMPGFHRLNRSKILHKWFGKPFVPPSKFSQAYSDLLPILNRITRQVCILEIAPPANFLVQNVGDFSAQVNHYNSILRNIESHSSCFIECWHNLDVSKYLLPDGHHLNLNGHQNVANKIIKTLGY